MVEFYAQVVEVSIGQVKALPDDAFTRDLDGMGLEEYWIKELDEMYRGVASAVSSSKGGGFSFVDFHDLQESLTKLKELGKEKFGWDLIDIVEYNKIVREQEDWEEGTGYVEEREDAPVIVEQVEDNE